MAILFLSGIESHRRQDFDLPGKNFVITCCELRARFL